MEIPDLAEDSHEDRLWREIYDARQAYFEASVGPLPPDILKMISMTGIWPGGGLFAIPAGHLGPELTLYTSFGLSNLGMNDWVEESQDETPQPAGFGYEILVIAPKDQDWPLAILQWAVNAEIIHGADFLYHVEKYDGITVEQVDVSAGVSVDLLVAKARPPLPTGTTLPNGRMEILVATVITTEEMLWAKKGLRGELLEQLINIGPGQVSVLKRASVTR